MLEARLGRDCVVVAVGGGVTTDLAGFVAATYLRGVPVVHVPTSYLAMIDATVGGKTGVDVRGGKNLVGAFHPPSLVVVDTEVLETLPRTQRGQGLVEGFKHGAILDESHFRALASGFEALMRADPDEAAARVADSVRIKAAVVTQDEFEGGYRQILNFGHTVGHAIEAASGYSLGHGTAVALGMLVEAEMGEKIGVTAAGTRTRLAEVLDPILHDQPPFDDVGGVADFLGSDKKARAGQPRYVLLERVGAVSRGESWTHTVPDQLVTEAVQNVVVRRGGGP
jgi:3-dehydroquinate synthase